MYRKFGNTTIKQSRILRWMLILPLLNCGSFWGLMYSPTYLSVYTGLLTDLLELVARKFHKMPQRK